MIERFRPDVLMSDIGMPDEDGYALMESIRVNEAQRPSSSCDRPFRARATGRRRACVEGRVSTFTSPSRSTRCFF